MQQICSIEFSYDIAAPVRTTPITAEIVVDCAQCRSRVDIQVPVGAIRSLPNRPNPGRVIEPTPPARGASAICEECGCMIGLTDSTVAAIFEELGRRSQQIIGRVNVKAWQSLPVDSS